jgi:dCMP deaminase
MNLEKAEKYFKLAKYQAELFSKDPVCKVGAILLAPNSYQILSMGYNGLPRKIEETAKRWERPLKYKYVEHAERNAIYNASRHGTPLEGAIAVITKFPCCDCARALIQSGISHIITETPDLNHPRWGEDFKISLELFNEVNIEIVKIDLKDT